VEPTPRPAVPEELLEDELELLLDELDELELDELELDELLEDELLLDDELELEELLDEGVPEELWPPPHATKAPMVRPNKP
jgi:hypothetical protein